MLRSRDAERPFRHEAFMSSPSTIFAPATPPGRAALAVVRVSGPAAADAARALLGLLPEARTAKLVTVRDPETGEALDQALALFFAGPASATGEDVLELHLHGSRAVRLGVIEALGKVFGLRLAEPGEFTRRAFLNGKLDLAAAEGLAALIDAETAGQRRQALRQLGGALGTAAMDWRARLISSRALVEAAIDFSDEGDVSDLTDRALAEAAGVGAEIEKALAGAAQGERLREGAVIVVAGPPNSGKSSLLNALARRDAAIVAPIAGTTRDVIEVALDLDGYPATLIDTAGLRETEDLVEAEGIRRARARVESADLVLWVTDASGPEEPGPEGALSIRNKVDLVGDVGPLDPRSSAVPISCRTGEGLVQLRTVLGERMQALMAGGEAALVVAARQRQALEDARQALFRAPSAALPELAAEDLRIAADAVGRITGAVGAEEVLDAVFGRFCIGK